MKKTFKTLTALLATATLAFSLTACNDKEPAKEGAKTANCHCSFTLHEP